MDKETKVDVKVGGFRLGQILSVDHIDSDGKLVLKRLPITEGLDVDYCYDGEHYITIATIRLTDDVYMETVGDRQVEYINEENINTYNTLCRQGMDILRILDKEMEEDY